MKNRKKRFFMLYLISFIVKTTGFVNRSFNYSLTHSELTKRDFQPLPSVRVHLVLCRLYHKDAECHE